MLQSYILLLLVSIANGLLPFKSFRKSFPTKESRGMTMYFDDVSRSSGGKDFENISPPAILSSSSSSSYHAQKIKAINRMLHRIDSVRDTTLTDEQVLRFTEQWAYRSNVLPSPTQDGGVDYVKSMYYDHLGSFVVNATSILECLVGYWKIVASLEKRDVYLQSENGISFIIFPNCRELYHYETMYMFVMSMHISLAEMQNRPSLALTVFHPHYKNSPVMLSPERHAPFPIVGLESSSNNGRRRSDDEDDLECIKESLEAIFSAPAASAAFNTNSAHDDSFPKENVAVPPSQAKSLTETWIQISNTKNNDALWNFDSVKKWIVSEQSSAACVYAEIWQLIADLQRHGQERHRLRHDHVLENTQQPNVLTSYILISTRYCRYDSQAWKHFAVTVNASLKRLGSSNEKMYLQVFHPEYVGGEEDSATTRRSPLPMIQVCYQNMSSF